MVSCARGHLKLSHRCYIQPDYIRPQAIPESAELVPPPPPHLCSCGHLCYKAPVVAIPDAQENFKYSCHARKQLIAAATYKLPDECKVVTDELVQHQDDMDAMYPVVRAPGADDAKLWSAALAKYGTGDFTDDYIVTEGRTPFIDAGEIKVVRSVVTGS